MANNKVAPFLDKLSVASLAIMTNRSFSEALIERLIDCMHDAQEEIVSEEKRRAKRQRVEKRRRKLTDGVMNKLYGGE